MLFLVTGAINIIKTITAFTIAHSITLGLSVFNLINLPQATVEVLIALTIVYLATEISSSNKYSATPWFMAFGFGLLHGLGFAGALGEIGISNDQILLSLLFLIFKRIGFSNKIKVLNINDYKSVRMGIHFHLYPDA